jgi:3-oxoacyl-[acyl-carrier protein] reductase
MDLKDKVVLITGASRGIGEAFAQIFAEEGCHLVLCARDPTFRLKAQELHFRKKGMKCVTLRADVTKKDDVHHVVETAIKTFGRIDILINNAGYATYKPLIEMSDGEYKETMDVNVKGMFLFSREVLPIMEKQGRGLMVMMSSISGKRPMAGLTVYCGSKFAVEGFTQSLAQEVTGNVKVCTICPGPVNTDMYRDNSPGEDYSAIDQPKDIVERVVKLIKKDIQNGASYNVGK